MSQVQIVPIRGRLKKGSLCPRCEGRIIIHTVQLILGVPTDVFKCENGHQFIVPIEKDGKK